MNTGAKLTVRAVPALRMAALVISAAPASAAEQAGERQDSRDVSQDMRETKQDGREEARDARRGQ